RRRHRRRQPHQPRAARLLHREGAAVPRLAASRPKHQTAAPTTGHAGGARDVGPGSGPVRRGRGRKRQQQLLSKHGQRQRRRRPRRPLRPLGPALLQRLRRPSATYLAPPRRATAAAIAGRVHIDSADDAAPAAQPARRQLP
ncbi:hypothetical protein LTR16_011773, partial [Cryomyces antarcticus]